jgi:radical SAM superfamily enzyme
VERNYLDFEVYVLYVASCEVVTLIWSDLIVHRMEEFVAREPEPEPEWSAEDGMIKREESSELSERDSEL